MTVKRLYGNTRSTGYSIDFFRNASISPKIALLAAPFFTTNEPVALLTERGCEVSLIVRLCHATFPAAIWEALRNPRVKVRYYTSRLFHVKFYIIDDTAMIGSANLTDSGLKVNRELSITVSRNIDEGFNLLPGIFDNLWDHADILTEQIAQQFETAFKAAGRPKDEDGFDDFLKNHVPETAPSSAKVGSNKVSRKRAFLQGFRRKYDELLIPAHDEIMAVALRNGFGRDEYCEQDPKIEMGRFLGWLRLVHGPRNGWKETTLEEANGREARINHYVDIWQSTVDTVAGDMYHAEQEIQNIQNIRDDLCNDEVLNELSFDQVFDHLCGCHAFLEQLRFTKGGLEGLRSDFKARNSLAAIKRTISYLLSGKGDPIERAYDCIYQDTYRLERFGEACVMELLGWGLPDRPPFNNRSIRGIRLLGFDVEQLVAGE